MAVTVTLGVMQCKTGGKAGVVLADWPMTALPAGGWTFLHWTGDANGTNASLRVTMDGPKTLQAVFGTAVPTATLGAGSVRLNSEQALYPYGASLRLTVAPGAGYFFVQWGNAVSNSANPLDFQVTNGNPTVAALFLPLLGNQVALTVIESPGGTVSRNPPANVYTSGQSVTLTAHAALGFEFSGWSGAATSAQNPLTLTLASNATVTAHFTNPLNLAAQMTPAGCLIHLSGVANAIYSLEASGNLRDWNEIAFVGAGSDGVVIILDASAMDHTQRFYRARQLGP